MKILYHKSGKHRPFLQLFESWAPKNRLYAAVKKVIVVTEIVVVPNFVRRDREVFIWRRN